MSTPRQPGLVRDKRNMMAYQTWALMRSRCATPSCAGYKNYGGRGITVCERWLVSFENFWADMGATWQAGLCLLRANTNGDYTPDNCRWAPLREQRVNKRNAIPGIDITAIAKETGIAYRTLHKRYRTGVPIAELTKPTWRQRKQS